MYQRKVVLNLVSHIWPNYDHARSIQHDVVLAIELLLLQDSINTSMGFLAGAMVVQRVVSYIYGDHSESMKSIKVWYDSRNTILCGKYLVGKWSSKIVESNSIIVIDQGNN